MGHYREDGGAVEQLFVVADEKMYVQKSARKKNSESY